MGSRQLIGRQIVAMCAALRFKGMWNFPQAMGTSLPNVHFSKVLDNGGVMYISIHGISTFTQRVMYPYIRIAGKAVTDHEPGFGTNSNQRAVALVLQKEGIRAGIMGRRHMALGKFWDIQAMRGALKSKNCLECP